MKLFYRLALCFCALVVLLTVTGCEEEDPFAPLYGKWQQSNPIDSQALPVVWEFTSEGSLILHSGETSVSFTYKRLGDSSFEVVGDVIYPTGLSNVEIFWEVEGDALSLSIFPQSHIDLSRVK